MSKKPSASRLPTMPTLDTEEIYPEMEDQEVEQPASIVGEVKYVTMKIPVVTGRHVGGYRTNAIQAKRLRVYERNAVHDILEGLKEVGAVLRDGKQVSDHCDVVRYILGLADEQLSGR